MNEKKRAFFFSPWKRRKPEKRFGVWDSGNTPHTHTHTRDSSHSHTRYSQQDGSRKATHKKCNEECGVHFSADAARSCARPIRKAWSTVVVTVRLRLCSPRPHRRLPLLGIPPTPTRARPCRRCPSGRVSPSCEEGEDICSHWVRLLHSRPRPRLRPPHRHVRRVRMWLLLWLFFLQWVYLPILPLHRHQHQLLLLLMSSTVQVRVHLTPLKRNQFRCLKKQEILSSC
jgi:hypothetical protein